MRRISSREIPCIFLYLLETGRHCRVINGRAIWIVQDEHDRSRGGTRNREKYGAVGYCKITVERCSGMRDRDILDLHALCHLCRTG